MSGGPYLLLNGCSEMPRYVRRLEPEVGVVHWTFERPRALRFRDRGQAEMVRAQIVARDGRVVAIVPDSPNARAMAELNRVAEW